MSGKQARHTRQKRRLAEHDAIRLAAHADDVRYFAQRPGALWRVREAVRGEWEQDQPGVWAPGAVPPPSHIIIWRRRTRGDYLGRPLAVPPGVDPAEAAAAQIADEFDLPTELLRLRGSYHPLASQMDSH